MQISPSKPLLFAAMSLLVLACGNRTELLEPPWGEPDDGGQGGAGGTGASGGSAGASGKGGTAGATGKGGSGGSSPVDACSVFCDKCSGTVSNCSTQCAQTKGQLPSYCLTLFNNDLLCAADHGCSQNSCQAELNALTSCMKPGP